MQREAEEGITKLGEWGTAMKATRWRRYGQDRTYLALDDGTQVGWIDNLSGEVHAKSDAHLVSISKWIQGNQSELGARPFPAHSDLAVRTIADADESEASESVPAEALCRDASNSDAATFSEWEDLALRVPGQTVRDQAKNELASNWNDSKFRTALRIAFDTHTDERAWRLGASGEETIGAKLEKLEAHGWRVLHSVPIGENGSDVDQMVIGPGGVWTINVKNHPGKKIWVAPRQIRVDGHIVPYLRNSEFEANRVRKLLAAQLGWEPYVRSALVFMTGTLVPQVTIKGEPEHVEILDRMDVVRRLKRQPVRLSAEQVGAVFELARRSTTWVP